MAAAPCYVDTNVVIALLDGLSLPTAAQRVFLDALDAGTTSAVTSALTLAECLVRPFSEADDVRISLVCEFLAGRPEFQVVAIDTETLVLAAQIRATSRNRLPDAIHIATAVQAGCAVLLSDDTGLRLPEGLRRVAWSTLEEGFEAD